jgi:hypothetical protein
MSEHRAEQILAKVLTTLTNLETTGKNIARGRYYAWPEDVENALEIYQGADEPVTGGDRSNAYTDGWLTINIDLIVKLITDLTESQLNKIRKEVTIALLATENLGLDFVMEVLEGSTSEPELNNSEKPTAQQTMQWMIKYRRSRTNPST